MLRIDENSTEETFDILEKCCTDENYKGHDFIVWEQRGDIRTSIAFDHFEIDRLTYL